MLWWWSIGADLGETLGWCVTQAAPFDKTHADTGGCRFVTASDQIPQQMTWGSGFPSFFPPARRRHITYWHTCKSAGEHSDTHLRGQRRGGRWDGGIKARGFNQLTENQPSSHIILVPFCCFNPPPTFPHTHTHTRAQTRPIAVTFLQSFFTTQSFPGNLGLHWACCTLTQLCVPFP